MTKSIDSVFYDLKHELITEKQAHERVLILFGVSKCTCEIPSPQTHWEGKEIKWTCFKCKKPT